VDGPLLDGVRLPGNGSSGTEEGDRRQLMKSLASSTLTKMLPHPVRNVLDKRCKIQEFRLERREVKGYSQVFGTAKSPTWKCPRVVLDYRIDLLIEDGVQDVESNPLILCFAGDCFLLGTVATRVHRECRAKVTAIRRSYATMIDISIAISR